MRYQIAARYRRSQAGLSAIEYVIALIIVMIAFVGWLQLTPSTIKQGAFTKKLADVSLLCSAKSIELSPKAVDLVKSLPKGGSVGSIAPQSPINGFNDQLNNAGEIISTLAGTQSANQDKVIVFKRQWMIVRDLPNDNDVTIFVSVSYNGSSGKVVKVTKKVNIEAIIPED